MSRLRFAVLVAAALAAFGSNTSCNAEDPKTDDPKAPPPTTRSPETAPPTERVVGPITPEESAALATMNDKIKAYAELHARLEPTLPGLPQEATPEEIDKHQRAFEKMMREARANAKQGDIFTPQAQPVIKKLLAQVFGEPEGKQLKASIMDENPINPDDIKITVNSRYPDSVPLSTIPPEVLQVLPALPEDLEYRFIGDWLILLDPHAHIIADYIPDALPK
jgi:hypothetical protein